MDNKFKCIFNIVKTVQGLNLTSKFQSEKKLHFKKGFIGQPNGTCL